VEQILGVSDSKKSDSAGSAILQKLDLYASRGRVRASQDLIQGGESVESDLLSGSQIGTTVSDKMPVHSRSITSPTYSVLYLCVYVIFDLKLCVNCSELGRGVRLTAKGKPWGCSHSTWRRNRLLTSVDWKHETMDIRVSPVTQMLIK
jgi:hypothetical protein